MNIIAISNHLYDESNLFKKENVLYLKDKNLVNFDYLNTIQPKYIFFPHWSYIIPQKVYENFNCIIFHMTDLPFGRGGSPLQNLIARGIYHTKITALKCSKIIDGGDIYLKKDFDISKGSAKDLYITAGNIISSMIDEIIITNPIPKKQSGDIVCFKRRTAIQSDISNLSNLKQIYDYIRMLDADGYPSAYLKINNIRYEFKNAQLGDEKITAHVEIRFEKDE